MVIFAQGTKKTFHIRTQVILYAATQSEISKRKPISKQVRGR